MESNSTNLEINKEIQEIIAKNLPAQVGYVLKEKLIQADKNIQEINDLKTKIEKYSNLILNHETTIKEYQKLENQFNLIESKEKQLEKRENKLLIDELTYKLASEKDKTEFSKSVALGLVRNIEYRNNSFSSETFNENHNDYQKSFNTHTNSNSTTTKIVE